MMVVGASKKIVEYIDYVPKINARGGEKPTSDVNGEISLQNVQFSYPSKKGKIQLEKAINPNIDVKALKGIDIEVKKNKVVALVGSYIGSGKSSIIQLIERFYDPDLSQQFALVVLITDMGSIKFDGRDIKSLDPKWYHQQVAIVSQEPVLFSGSIRENIIYGLESSDLSQQDIEMACKQANALDFVQDRDQFPDGFDTTVGERGLQLSGGQKQRIAIARALIRKPKVLIFDEATSGKFSNLLLYSVLKLLQLWMQREIINKYFVLQQESEHQVQKALDELLLNGEQTIILKLELK